TGENMVELVDDHAGEGSAEYLLAFGGLPVQQLFLYKSPDAVAIDFGERKDCAIADVGPAQWPRVELLQCQSLDVAVPFEGQNSQFRRNFVSGDAGKRPPGEMAAERPHDGVDFVFE